MKELNWPWIRGVLKYRRHARYMRKSGYEHCEPDWEIIRGSKIRTHFISDVQVGIDGKGIWYKTVKHPNLGYREG